MITAAHCIDPNAPTNIRMVSGNRFDTKADFQTAYQKGIMPDKVLYAQKAGDQIDLNNAKDRQIDSAVLIFDSNKVKAPAITPLRGYAVEEGESAVVVGYGSTSVAGAHGAEVALVKRFGKNSVTTKSQLGRGIFIKGRASTDPLANIKDDALAGYGDSGGPLFIDSYVAGVVSGGFLDPSDNSQAIGVFVDLTTNQSKALLDEAKAQGANISEPSSPPEVESQQGKTNVASDDAEACQG